MARLPDADGVLTPEAHRTYKFLGLLGAVAAVGFVAAQLVSGPPARAAAPPPAPSAALGLSSPDIAARLDRIEAAISAQGATLNATQLDVAVIKSQVQDLRGRRP